MFLYWGGCIVVYDGSDMLHGLLCGCDSVF